MALTKAQMAEHLIGKLGFTSKEAKEMVELFFEELRITLELGEEIKLSGFGNFQLLDKAERPGRNPKTGEDVPISARRIVNFKIGKKLRQRVELLPTKVPKVNPLNAN